MPLPLIPLVGIAVLLAGYGVKKGFDAKSSKNDAKAIDEDAQDIRENARQSLDGCRKKTHKALESLGRQKLLLYRDALAPFVRTFSKIKNVDYELGDIRDDKRSYESIDGVRKFVQRMEEVTGGPDVLTGLLSGGAAGALTGLAAYGSVGVLASASTGTPIIVLSGAAATSATLAWFGGGSLAAGGLGMLGGTAVLGGIVAAPVLLVGGLMMASKAEEAKKKALSNWRIASKEATEMEEAEVVAHDIGRTAKQVRSVLKQLQDYLCNDLNDLQELVSVRSDYCSFDVPERELVHRTLSFAVTAKDLYEAPLLDEDGSITPAIRQQLKVAKKVLAAAKAKAKAKA